MKILVSGSSGLVGGALVPSLSAAGHEVKRLLRKGPAPADWAVVWDPDSGSIDRPALEGTDAVVHLAGENIATGRWTAEKKARIRDSRVRGTRLMAGTLSRLERPPRVFVGASAIGYYGDRGEERLTEESAAGSGFLSEVCRDWEAAAEPARQRGIRVVHLRYGVVLARRGGALAKMLPPFRLGLGGRIGDGRQFMSWVSLEDAVGIIHHALVTEALAGPVNAVAPSPVANREFTRTLGRVLGRPTLFPVPAAMVRLLFGEMGDTLLLAGSRVFPRRLEQSGYRFRHPDLESALRAELGRPVRS